jgi:hypothetical protein
MSEIIADGANDQAAKRQVFFQRALATSSRLRSRSTLARERLVDEKRARFLEDLVEFLGRHFSN